MEEQMEMKRDLEETELLGELTDEEVQSPDHEKARKRQSFRGRGYNNGPVTTDSRHYDDNNDDAK